MICHRDVQEYCTARRVSNPKKWRGASRNDERSFRSAIIALARANNGLDKAYTHREIYYIPISRKVQGVNFYRCLHFSLATDDTHTHTLI